MSLNILSIKQSSSCQQHEKSVFLHKNWV